MAEREFILGGQKSGKSRRAEERARAWLAVDPTHRAVLVATATAYDDEMHARIVRHQTDRAARVPRMRTLEEPIAISQTLAAHSAPGTLVIIDCLTLWLTNLLMPMAGATHDAPQASAAFCKALRGARGPVVVVGNEIGLGVIPLGREVRTFVDALGLLNQAVAAACDRVTLMVAGLPLTLKEPE